MREPLVVAVAQPLCLPYGVAANAVARAVAVRAAGARVVVFPELSLTGHELDAPALTAGDPRLTPIVEACAEAGSVALVGAPVQGEAGLPLALVGAATLAGLVAARRRRPRPQ
jgi:predicted amidohydrolase